MNKKSRPIFSTIPFIVLLVTLFFLGYKVECKNKQLQYNNPKLWYRDANKSGNKEFDVFYILPTCVFDRLGCNSDTLHYANPFLDTDREAMRPSFELAEEIFGEQSNFYSPYYRQITLEPWRSDSLIKSLFPFAFSDIKSSFTYYLKNINKGRPFIIAGFSQGAKCVVELLKTLNHKQYKQLIAAYVIGYRVTATDTLNYKQIQPATGEKDTGVTICYNSVASPESISPLLSPSAICINPINWTTTSSSAPLNDTVTVTLDKYCNALIVKGLNPDKYYLEFLSYLFKKGNYHLQELYFYLENLKKNVAVRYNEYKLSR